MSSSMNENARALEIFLDIQRGLTRQGPGDDESTRNALALCRGLPDRPVVLDIGCGPGGQTMALAKVLNGPITAVDIHEEYLEQLRQRAAEAGFGARIEVLSADMNALNFAPRNFDLIWAEGSAYIMGFEQALATWTRFLKPGGFIAFSELVWLRPEPPAEVAAFFASEYPAMTDVETNLKTIEARGYGLMGHFTLPDAAWWRSYYTPLEAKLPALREKYATDSAALELIEMTRREIDMRRRFRDWYGYEFFIGRKPD